MSLILNDISHTYHPQRLEARTVLQPTGQLTLASGAQVLLRGISGSGKTTLLNILAGLLHPTAGEITLSGKSLYAMSETQRDRFRNQHIGYVFQNHHLIPMLTAVENVAMPLAFAGLGKKERHARAEDLLQQVGLTEFLAYHPAQLSTGQRLRVAAVRALINQPTLILADEPTAALDKNAAQEMMALLQETSQQTQAILIVASHDPAVSERFDTIWDLHNGVLTIHSPATTTARPGVSRHLSA